MKFCPTCLPPLNYACEFQHKIPVIGINVNHFISVELCTDGPTALTLATISLLCVWLSEPEE
jgi:hypothetical protein